MKTEDDLNPPHWETSANNNRGVVSNKGVQQMCGEHLVSMRISDVSDSLHVR